MKRYHVLIIISAFIFFGISSSGIAAPKICDNSFLNHGDLLVLENRPNGACWKKIISKYNANHIAGRKLTLAYYISPTREFRSVIAIKEKVSTPTENPVAKEARDINLYRPNVIECETSEKRNAVGKIFQEGNGYELRSDIISYLKYHRSRGSDRLPVFRKFHFSYTSLIDGLLKCIDTYNWANRNRSIYDFEKVKPEIANLEKTISKLLNILVSTAHAVSSGENTLNSNKQVDIYYQVRHQPIHVYKNQKKIFVFKTQKPSLGSSLSLEIAILQLQNRYRKQYRNAWVLHNENN